MNRQELMNEIFVLLAAYPLLIFSNAEWSNEQNIDAGWILLSIVGLIVACNISLSFYVLAHWLRLKCRRYQVKKAHGKLMAERELKRLEREAALAGLAADEQKRLEALNGLKSKKRQLKGRKKATKAKKDKNKVTAMR